MNEERQKQQKDQQERDLNLIKATIEEAMRLEKARTDKLAEDLQTHAANQLKLGLQTQRLELDEKYGALLQDLKRDHEDQRQAEQEAYQEQNNNLCCCINQLQQELQNLQEELAGYQAGTSTPSQEGEDSLPPSRNELNSVS